MAILAKGNDNSNFSYASFPSRFTETKSLTTTGPAALGDGSGFEPPVAADGALWITGASVFDS
jgi:hypothetical protein